MITPERLRQLFAPTWIYSCGVPENSDYVHIYGSLTWQQMADKLNAEPKGEINGI
jgi:hypothetical protein